MSEDGDPAVTERYIPCYTPLNDITARGGESVDDDFKRMSVGSETGTG